MKRNRLIWFALWILSIVGISFYGGTVSYGFFATLTLVPIFSLLYLLLVYVYFRIYQKIENRYIVVNETVPFHFSLVNEYFMLFAGIRVIFYSSFSTINGLSDETEYELLPHTGIEKETALICHYRGEYKVGIKRIEIQDFFRLFKISYKNKEGVNAVVRPQLVRLEQLGDIDLACAVKDSNTNATEMDVLSREYVPGDEPRWIHWNQTARTGTLMTRQLVGQDYQEITILMDTCRRSKEQMEYLPLENKLLETTLAVAYYLSRNYLHTTEYHFYQTLIQSGVGTDAEFNEFYERLSTVSFSDRNTHTLFCEAVKLRPEIFRSSMIFLIVSFWSSDMEALLETFENSNLYIVVYLITDDKHDGPDLTNHTKIKLVRISPHANLQEVMQS